MAEKRQYCTFYVDGRYFGLDVRRVQEVICHKETTRVPLAPREVHGLLNLRGQIVTAIDLRRRLNLSERPGNQLPLNVVVQTDDGAVSLLVDQVGDIVEVSDDLFERPPETMTPATHGVIRGAYKLPSCLLLLLDVDKLIQVGNAE